MVRSLLTVRWLGYGHRGGDSKVDSLFGLMFSIVKQRKKNKMGFLRALVKPFEYDIKDVSTAEVKEEDPNFVVHLFMVANWDHRSICHFYGSWLIIFARWISHSQTKSYIFYITCIVHKRRYAQILSNACKRRMDPRPVVGKKKRKKSIWIMQRWR